MALDMAVVQGMAGELLLVVEPVQDKVVVLVLESDNIVELELVLDMEQDVESKLKI